MSQTDIPDKFFALLQRPLHAGVGTLQDDGTMQINPMWFELVDDTIRFSTLTTRRKYRNLQARPNMTVMVIDTDDPMSYVEVRGEMVEARPDPEGECFVRLAKRYDFFFQETPPDKADRVELVMRIDAVSGQ